MATLLIAVIYIAFISLGLPDSILGAAWPSIYPGFGVPVSYAGIISMIIAAGTILSSLLSDRLTRRLGAGLVTALSVGTTALALFGFSLSSQFWMLCLWAVPYGLGAGSVDASPNNYVALHYSSRHMNWLHCMWGLGASIGPYIMGLALTHSVWQTGYRSIAFLQVGLTAVILLSLPLWKKRKTQTADGKPTKALTLRQVFGLRGAKAAMVTFFAYCAIEQTAGLWAASYLVLHHGVDAELAATFASLFYIGITVGRGISGFISIRFTDRQMVRLGSGLIALGVALLFLPLSSHVALTGLIVIGIGCAPVYPALLHATPGNFGEEYSQAVMGVQMACAYVGILAMPPLFGLIANNISISLLPVYLTILLAVMLLTAEYVNRVIRSP